MSEIENQFDKQPPEKRAELLKAAIMDLSQSVKEEQPPFALLAYGSGVYGFNPQDVGKLSDLDLLAISPREHELLKVLGSLKRMGVQLNEDLSLLSLTDKLKTGKIDFFRIQGTYQGITTSVHFFAHDSLKGKHAPPAAFEKIYGGLTEIQVAKKQGIKDDREEVDFKGIVHKIKYMFTGLKNDFDSTGYESAISRKILPDQSTVVPTVGVQAEKILDGKLLYEPMVDGKPLMQINNLVDKYWRTFVRSALFYRPQVSNDEIINLLARSSRFSEEFRQELRQKIQMERERFELQLLKKAN